MRPTRLLLLSLLLLGTASAASAQEAGPLAALLNRVSNPNGPFARLAAPLAGKTALAPAAPQDSLVARARGQLGKRYKFAAASPTSGFDCSGLVKYVLDAFGVDLPHSAARIAKLGTPVKSDSLQPGDLLMFGRGRSARVSHVGIYIGDGKMIHASTSQRRVIETAVPDRQSSLKLQTVRRVLGDSTARPHGSE